MDRIRFNRLETLVQDLIDDVSGEYSQEMYDEDMRNLEEFIEQELDRAREEGRREQQKLDCDLYGTAMATEEQIEEKWGIKDEVMRDVLKKRKLSKLTTK